MLALSSEERQQFTHHSIRTSLARRSSRRSPASKNVQGESLPPLGERLSFTFLPSHPLPFLWLPWEVTGHSCPAHGRMPSVLPCVSHAKQWQEWYTLPQSQAARGKTEVVPAWKSTEKSYLQSGPDLLVGQGSPVRRA